LPFPPFFKELVFFLLLGEVSFSCTEKRGPDLQRQGLTQAHSPKRRTVLPFSRRKAKVQHKE
jgi:hypothetical protein